jgi:SAM-dependent methyltransferase
VQDYLEVNRKAYNLLASTYQRNVPLHRGRVKAILTSFVRYLESNFVSPIRVLDVGCGSGLSLSILAEHQYAVVGIDLSDKMLDIAHKTCPKAVLLRGDFLQTDFCPESFDGMLALSSLHLLPKTDALSALAKVRTLLTEGGIFHLATTLNDRSDEGYYEKTECGISVVRYRKYWARDELVEAILDAGLRIHQEVYDTDAVGKTRWINLLATKAATQNRSGM